MINPYINLLRPIMKKHHRKKWIFSLIPLNILSSIFVFCYCYTSKFCPQMDKFFLRNPCTYSLCLGNVFRWIIISFIVSKQYSQYLEIKYLSDECSVYVGVSKSYLSSASKSHSWHKIISFVWTKTESNCQVQLQLIISLEIQLI